MYDPSMVEPMRKELTEVGFKELKSEQEVDQHLGEHKGISLVVVNSVCGCAAGSARPGVRLAVENDVVPSELLTVFAGQDADATNKARSYFHGYAPSSPSIALLKDGEVVHMMERMDIEGHSAEEISGELKAAFYRHCEELNADTKIEELLNKFPSHAKKIVEVLGKESGPLSSCDGDTQSLIEKTEDVLDEEPPLGPVAMTPEGAAQFKKIREQEGAPNAGLALGAQGLGFKENADASDITYESEGIKIFVDNSVAKRYSNRKVHFSEGPNGGGFSII